jgi:hypothetical protein
LIRTKSIFTPFEFDRKVPLMFILNIMCAYKNSYYERNNLVRKFLEDRAENFPDRDEVMGTINGTAEYISKMNFAENSMWWKKANVFTLVAELACHPELRLEDVTAVAGKLLTFAQNVPASTAWQRGQRELRGKAIRDTLAHSL